MKHWKGSKLWVKSLFLKYYKRLSLLAKPNCLKFVWYTTLYMLDLFGFGPKFGLLHYVKLPSYKIVKWGRLAGPFHSYDIRYILYIQFGIQQSPFPGLPLVKNSLPSQYYLLTWLGVVILKCSFSLYISLPEEEMILPLKALQKF